MRVGTPMHPNNETVQAPKRGGGWKMPLFLGGLIIGGTFLFSFFGNGKNEEEQESAEIIDMPNKKTKREEADEEKKKLTPSELGKLGAKKRWGNKKKAEEKPDNTEE